MMDVMTSRSANLQLYQLVTKGSTRRWPCSKPLVVIAALEGTGLILKI